MNVFKYSKINQFIYFLSLVENDILLYLKLFIAGLLFIIITQIIISSKTLLYWGPKFL